MAICRGKQQQAVAHTCATLGEQDDWSVNEEKIVLLCSVRAEASPFAYAQNLYAPRMSLHPSSARRDSAPYRVQ
jgi:hypothetical protein